MSSGLRGAAASGCGVTAARPRCDNAKAVDLFGTLTGRPRVEQRPSTSSPSETILKDQNLVYLEPHQFLIDQIKTVYAKIEMCTLPTIKNSTSLI